MHANGHVLIVEDDQPLAKLMALQLKLDGRDSEFESSADAVMDRLRLNGSIACVLVDLKIGNDENAGTKLYTRIRGVYKDMPIVFVSSFASLADNYPGVPLVIKRPQELELFYRDLVLKVQGAIRNRCRDVQIEKTLELSSRAVEQNSRLETGLADIHAILTHPESGLAATHATAKKALEKSFWPLLHEALEMPGVRIAVGTIGGLLVIAALLLAAVLKLSGIWSPTIGGGPH